MNAKNTPLSPEFKLQQQARQLQQSPYVLQQPRQLQLKAAFLLKRTGILQSYLQIAAVFSGNRQSAAF